MVILNYQKEHDFNVFISIDKNTKSFDKTAWTKHNLGMTDKFMEITKHQNNMPHLSEHVASHRSRRDETAIFNVVLIII